MLSGIITGLLLALFVGGCIWAWSPKHKRAFDQAARIPLQDADADVDAGQDGMRPNGTHSNDMRRNVTEMPR